MVGFSSILSSCPVTLNADYSCFTNIVELVYLTNHTRFILCTIILLVIYSLEGGHTNTDTHKQYGQKKPGMHSLYVFRLHAYTREVIVNYTRRCLHYTCM